MNRVKKFQKKMVLVWFIPTLAATGTIRSIPPHRTDTGMFLIAEVMEQKTVSSEKCQQAVFAGFCDPPDAEFIRDIFRFWTARDEPWEYGDWTDDCWTVERRGAG